MATVATLIKTQTDAPLALDSLHGTGISLMQHLSDQFKGDY